LAVLEFGHGRAAPAVAVTEREGVAPAVRALNLGTPRPTVVVVGDAVGLVEGEPSAFEPLVGAIVRTSVAFGAAAIGAIAQRGDAESGGFERDFARERGRQHAWLAERLGLS
jgi:hypothetical protein